MIVYIQNPMGAGDHANMLPVLNYLSTKHTVLTDIHPVHKAMYMNTKIIKYENQPYDYHYRLRFEDDTNIPAKEFFEKSGLITEEDLEPIQNTSGIVLSAEEMMRKVNSAPYVNIFPYTTIPQKTINAGLMRKIARYIYVTKHLRVFTAVPLFDSKSSKYPWDMLGCEYHFPVDYFSREWILNIACAQATISCDGGPFNVSLAAKVNHTIGLLTIADESLAMYHNNWSVLQSTVSCSPCFKPADYNTLEVTNCKSLDNFCGNNFNLDEIFSIIDKKIEPV